MIMNCIMLTSEFVYSDQRTRLRQNMSLHLDDFLHLKLLDTILDGEKKGKGKKKKKGKKAKMRLHGESECENNGEGGSEDLTNGPNSDADNSGDLSSASSLSDIKHLQLDGMMKTAPTYGDEEVCKQEFINDNSAQPTIIIEGETLNARALDQYARTYELEKFEKNYLIIFNQENITNYEPRRGTDKDVKALKDTFSKYKFECYDYHDLTKDEIIDTLKIFASKNFTDYGCIAVAVLTHGNSNGLLRAKDREYSEMEIINYFKTHDKPTLITKPKLLIIQACRGLRLTPGVPVMRSLQLRMDRDVEVEPYTLPVESDMLILHSSYIGCPSIRNEVDGSWFIQTLCKKIDEFSKKLDLESILTEVKREVAIDLHYDQYNRITYEVDIYKQMPVITSTLIRKLYLRQHNEQEITLVDGQLDTFLSRTTSSDGQSEMAASTRSLTKCMCYLHHFAYMRNCLSYFLEVNPHDKVAQSYFDISTTFEDTADFNAPKEMMAKAICNHLKYNATNHDYYKFIYMHKH